MGQGGDDFVRRFSLELGETVDILHTDSRSREQDDIGFVFVSDLLEILGALGIEYVPPTVRYQYEWR